LKIGFLDLNRSDHITRQAALIEFALGGFWQAIRVQIERQLQDRKRPRSEQSFAPLHSARETIGDQVSGVSRMDLNISPIVEDKKSLIVKWCRTFLRRRILIRPAVIVDEWPARAIWIECLLLYVRGSLRFTGRDNKFREVEVSHFRDLFL